MKREYCVLLLTAAMLLSGCSRGNSSTAAQETEPKSTPDISTTARMSESPGITQETNVSNVAGVSPATTQILWSTDVSIEGRSARFYITGDTEYDDLIGDLWFENDCDTRRLLSDAWFSAPAVYNCGGVKMLVTDERYATYSVSHAFTVVDGKAVEIPINGSAQMQLSPDGDRGFTALSSEFEGNMAHTWKPYWYTFSANELSFVSVCGQVADKNALPWNMTDRIAQDGGTVSEVIVFDNGITAVNYITENYGTEFQYYRLYENGDDITPEDNRGHYRLPQ